jgi:RND family efflux transporter MFP subunit
MLKIDSDKKPGGLVGRRQGRRAWRYILVASTVLVFAYLFYGKVIGPSVGGVEVGVVKQLYRYEAFTMLVATGYVTPRMQADVATKATGRLEWLGVEEGSVVEKGELIARLDNEDVSAAKQKAAAEVEVAKARLAEVEAELRNAERSLRRTAALVEKKVVTEEGHDAAVARREKADAAVKSAEAAVSSAKAALYGASVNVESTLIRAPFDGVVLRKYANIGDIVAPFSSTIESKGAVISMADLDTLEVEVDVSESDLHKVSVKQPCVIELEAFPDLRFRCDVNRIVPAVDKAKATVLVRVRFVDKDSRILPNMTARVAFLSRAPTPSDTQPVIVMPASSVVERNGGLVAFLLNGDSVSRVSVAEGVRIGDTVQIGGGLGVGDRVILQPWEGLEDGARINLPTLH